MVNINIVITLVVYALVTLVTPSLSFKVLYGSPGIQVCFFTDKIALAFLNSKLELCVNKALHQKQQSLVIRPTPQVGLFGGFKKPGRGEALLQK